MTRRDLWMPAIYFIGVIVFFMAINVLPRKPRTEPNIKLDSIMTAVTELKAEVVLSDSVHKIRMDRLETEVKAAAADRTGSGTRIVNITGKDPVEWLRSLSPADKAAVDRYINSVIAEEL